MRKKYASDSVGVKRTLIWVGVLVLVVAIVMAIPPLRTSIWLMYGKPELSETVWYGVDRGVTATTDDAEFRLPNVTGGELQDPIFLQTRNGFIFAEQNSKVVGVITPEAELQWISLDGLMEDQERIVRIHPSNDGALVVVKDFSDSKTVKAQYRPTKTLALAVHSRNARVLDPNTEVQVEVDGGRRVHRTQEGDFVLSDPATNVIAQWPDVHFWNYDFTNDVLIGHDGRTIYVSQSGQSSSFRPSYLSGIYDAYPMPERREIWVEVKRMLRGSAVLRYDYSGELLGMAGESKGRLRGPYYVGSDALQNVQRSLR